MLWQFCDKFVAIFLWSDFSCEKDLMQELLEIHRSVAKIVLVRLLLLKHEIRSDIMSVENVKKFYEMLSQDEAMKQKFVELSKEYQGQQMDEAKTVSLLAKEALSLATQMGYSFTMDDLLTYGEEMQQADMNRELSEEEMTAVTGGGCSGTNRCIFIGVPSGDFSGFCFLYGEIKHGDTASTECCAIGTIWTST